MSVLIIHPDHLCRSISTHSNSPISAKLAISSSRSARRVQQIHPFCICTTFSSFWVSLWFLTNDASIYLYQLLWQCVN